MKRVAVVVLHFGSIENTKECLESISKLQITNYKLQIIVIDNGSQEKFKIQNSRLRQGFSGQAKFKIIRNEENLGFAGGNNVGISYAIRNGVDYIMILNNDTIVHPELINELVKTIESSEKIGIVVPKIYFAPSFEFHKNRYKKEELGKVIWYAGGVMDWKNVIGSHRGVDEVDVGQYAREEEIDFASGCCMFVKREVYAKIGFLDDKYFLYYEDSDFSLRAKRGGFKVVFAPRAMLWHKNAASAGGSGSSLQDYYITRNRLLFGMRYAPIRSKISLIRESAKLLLSGREWQKQGVMDFYKGKFGRGSYCS